MALKEVCEKAPPDKMGITKEEIKFDVPPIIKIYLLKRLTFANNYTGRVGIFFINAEFEEGPL